MSGLDKLSEHSPNPLLMLEVSARIGETLLQIQQTEKVLKVCMNYVVPKRPKMDWEKIVDEANKREKSTLGTFIHDLRERLQVEKTFDDLLLQFLKDRNSLAHDFLSVPGVDISSDKGLEAALEFLIDLSKRAVHIRDVLLGFTRLVEQALKGSPFPGLRECLTDNGRFYEAIALMALRAKTSV